jgi:hypothetical protein
MPRKQVRAHTATEIPTNASKAHEKEPFHFSIRGITSDIILLGDSIVLGRYDKKPPLLTCWSDGGGGWYSITQSSESSFKDGHVDIYSIGEFEPGMTKYGPSARREVGEAYICVILLDNESYKGQPEKQFQVARAAGFSFVVPKLLWSCYEGRVGYFVYTALHGVDIATKWPLLTDKDIRDLVITDIADAHLEMAKWSGKPMLGLDETVPVMTGGLESCNIYGDDPPVHGAELLIENCEKLGIDCDDIVLSINDIDPRNIIVSSSGAFVGFQEWWNAGYVPKDWVFTKIGTQPDFNSMSKWSRDDKTRWILGLYNEMKRLGFRDFTTEFLSWKKLP